MKGAPIQYTVYKRMFSEKEAASYAGMTLTEFRRECPVRAIARAQGKKVWDVNELDQWLDPAPRSTPNASILARL